MDLSTSISIIIQDLNRACEIIDDLKSYPGVPLLQIELAKSKCRSAAEVISLLPSLGIEATATGSTAPSENKDSTTYKIEKELVTAEKISVVKAAAVIEEPVQPPPGEESATETTVFTDTEQPVPRANATAGQSSEVPEAVSAEEDRVKPSNGSGILADQFNNLSKSFNEELGNMKHEDDIAGKLRSKPVHDLSDAIGVNDRFVFIREIFNGSYETYSRAISELNSAGNISDARQVLTGYTGSKAENEAVRQLMELVKRKFQIHG
ncbi:MAG: hypothetical protein RBU28_02515 [Bacteroidales bacterium]|jgi:hypothetical protein|nr:hypothetical protein [Bacteroidales bacterium]